MIEDKPKEGMDLLAKAMRKVFQEEILDPLREDMEERLGERIDAQGSQKPSGSATWGRGRRRSGQAT